MRNIKQTLRYTRNSALLLAAATGLVYMTACSSDVDYKFTQKVSESNVTVGNNPSDQASRITFFGGGTRADEPTFPEVGMTAPTKVPAGLPTITSFSNWNGNGSPASYEIPETAWGSNQITVGGWDNSLGQNVAGEVYITGKVTGVTLLRGQGTVYVIGDGELDLTDQELQIENSVTLKYYNPKGITVGKDLKIDGGNQWNPVKSAQLLTPYNVYVKGNLNIAGELVSLQDITIEGKIQYNNPDGLVKGRCIEVQADDDRAVDMSGNGRLAIVSYLSCNGLYINGGSVYFYLNAMADVDGDTRMVDPSNVQYYTSSGNEESKRAHALLRTNKVIFEGTGDNPELIGKLFGANLKLKYDEYQTQNAPSYAGKFPASADDYYISKNGCNPGNGTPEDRPFDPIAVIDGPTHTHHHLSATCVQDVNGRAYVSYHLNEAYTDNDEWANTSLHMGCVEVYNVTTEKAEITNWLMNQNFDFNHLIVDNNKVYTVGDTHDFGATLGVIELDGNGGFGQYETDTEGRAEVMKEYSLYGEKEQKGSSGNCIIRDGNSFRVASYRGFQSLNAESLEVDEYFIETDGSAKHIAKGGGYIVTLNLDKKGVTESPATVTVYNSWGTPVTSFQTSKVITPINGKNVIATDGQNIYVALGQKGVDKYDMSGNLVGSYSWIDEKLATNPNYKGKPLANGLCIDDKYVYVANGAAGLIALNKSDMKRVARYAHATKFEEEEEDAEAREFSANYVQKVGNLIYIAYGRNGLEIVKMNEE